MTNDCITTDTIIANYYYVKEYEPDIDFDYFAKSRYGNSIRIRRLRKMCKRLLRMSAFL